MKSRNATIKNLLITALFFSIIGTATAKQEEQNSSARPKFFLLEDGLALIQPFTMSVSIEKIIDLLKQFPPAISYNIVKKTVEDKYSPLSKDDKQQLILGLAHAFYEHPATQQNFFNLLPEIEKTSEAQSFLINSVKNDYGTIIPALIKWAKNKQKEYPDLKDIAKKALYRTIDNNDVDALEKLHDSGIAIDTKQASDLLWYAVEHNKSADFIPFLANQGADLSISKQGHTLVTKATEHNNKAIIKALVTILKNKGESKQKIADYINRFADPSIGSPIQIAIEKGYTNLELYLREQGAMEK